MGGNAPVELRRFEIIVRSYNCQIRKTTKEWEVIDSEDGQWVCSFAVVSGRKVKRFYVNQFEKLIQRKRNIGSK
jgi:hypothetical protein